MKSKNNMAAGYVLMAAILGFSFYGLGQSLASGEYESDDHDLDHEYHEEYEHNGQQVAGSANPVYLKVPVIDGQHDGPAALGIKYAAQSVFHSPVQ